MYSLLNPADGDARQRCIQNKHYILKFPAAKSFLKKMEFPYKFGFRQLDMYDIAMSDVLHIIKKLRNNTKYLNTRLIGIVVRHRDPGLK